jgi:hypothetical protein
MPPILQAGTGNPESLVADGGCGLHRGAGSTGDHCGSNRPKLGTHLVVYREDEMVPRFPVNSPALFVLT